MRFLSNLGEWQNVLSSIILESDRYYTDFPLSQNAEQDYFSFESDHSIDQLAGAVEYTDCASAKG